MMTDMFDPNGFTNVNRKDIESIENSKVSPMPEGLLNTLQKDEILDLLAYLLSGGQTTAKR
jgi:ribosome assembly protein YihI (activator of Der GTPase)